MLLSSQNILCFPKIMKLLPEKRNKNQNDYRDSQLSSEFRLNVSLGGCLLAPY